MKRIFLALVLAVFVGGLVSSGVVFAQSTTFDPDAVFPSWGKTGAPEVEGVIGTNTDQKLLMNYVPSLINIALKFISPLILIVLVMAGVRMIIAADDTEAVAKSKNVIRYCVTGVVVILLSYSLVRATYFFFIEKNEAPEEPTSEESITGEDSENEEEKEDVIDPSIEESINSAYDSIISTLKDQPKDASKGDCIEVTEEVKRLLQTQLDAAQVLEDDANAQIPYETQQKGNEAKELFAKICTPGRSEGIASGNDPVANVRAAQPNDGGGDEGSEETAEEREERIDLGGFYSVEDGTVYYRGRVVEEADVNSFEYIGGGFARAGNTFYEEGIANAGIVDVALVGGFWIPIYEVNAVENPSTEKLEEGERAIEGLPPIPTSDDPVERVQLLEKALSDFQSSGEPTYAGSRGGIHLRELMIELNAARESLEVEKTSLENSLGLFYRKSIKLLEDKAEGPGSCIDITPEDQTKLDKDEVSRSNLRTKNASVYALISDSITLGSMEATLGELVERICSE